MTHVIEADLRNIKTPEALQVYLGFVLRAPDWYGCNLDALYDVLTETACPTLMRVLPPTCPDVKMSAYIPRLIRVLDDAADACPEFAWEEVSPVMEKTHAGR